MRLLRDPHLRLRICIGAGRLLAILRLRWTCGSGFFASAGTNWAKVSRTRAWVVASANGEAGAAAGTGGATAWAIISRRRNNGRQAGVVYHPFRRLLVGTNANHGLVDRRSGLAGHNRLLWDERIDRHQQREQHSADKQEITRYGHVISLPPREHRAVQSPNGRYTS